MMRSVEIGLIALGACNRKSVAAALERAGARVAAIESCDALDSVDAFVLPGVANFGFAARALDERGLREPVLAAIRSGLPVLGICAGYQLLFDGSDEAPGQSGLGILRGNVRALRGPKRQHVGWNEVELCSGAAGERGWAYFAHAYAPEAKIDGVQATTVFGERFASVARAGSVMGVQFHPERSGAYGARLLQGFVESSRCAYVG